MSFEMFIGAFFALLFAAVVAVVVVLVTKGVRGLKTQKIMKTVKKIVGSGDEDELVIEVSRNISFWIKGFDITALYIDGTRYESLGEALIREPLNPYRRYQLTKVEKELDAAYELHKKQSKKVATSRHQDAVVEQQVRKPKFVEKHNTGIIAGVVHVYKPCVFIVSDKLKAEIVKNEEGLIGITKVHYAPEGSVRSAQLTIPFDVLNKEGKGYSAKFKHYIQDNDIFAEEMKVIEKMLKNMMHYNDLLEAGRLVFKDGKLVSVLPADLEKEEKEESKPADPKTEAKETVEDLVELEDVHV